MQYDDLLDKEILSVKKRDIDRSKILAFEAQLEKIARGEADNRHHFAPGVYAREQRIPKGTLLTGKIHKTEHLNIISKGRIAVVWPGGAKIVEAPHTMISKPGVKRVGFALEDTVWTTIHVTEETDLEIIEDEVIAKTFDEVDALLANDAKILLESDNIGEIGEKS